jgi:hypothetical protein
MRNSKVLKMSKNAFKNAYSARIHPLSLVVINSVAQLKALAFDGRKV